jgi:hypothetical protein
MLGCAASLLLTVALAKRVDHGWRLVRRAAGHDQQRGALERIFALSVALAALAFVVWLLVLAGPAAAARPARLTRWACSTTTGGSRTSTRPS